MREREHGISEGPRNRRKPRRGHLDLAFPEVNQEIRRGVARTEANRDLGREIERGLRFLEGSQVGENRRQARGPELVRYWRARYRAMTTDDRLPGRLVRIASLDELRSDPPYHPIRRVCEPLDEAGPQGVALVTG